LTDDPIADPYEDDIRVMDAEPEETPEQFMSRDEDLTRRAGVHDALASAWADIDEALEDHRDRNMSIEDNWDLYHGRLNHLQNYAGRSQYFVPLVHDAVEARQTRFTNQLFPRAQRFVDSITEDGSQPFELLALLEHYVRRAQMHTHVVPTLVRHGDIEGQYNVYVDWERLERNTVIRETMETGLPGESIEIIRDELVIDQGPRVEVLHDADVIVTPATASSVEDALARGGAVCIVRRWTRADVRQKISTREIEKRAGRQLLRSMTVDESSQYKIPDESNRLAAAGVRKDGRGVYAVVWEIWLNLYIDGERRLCRAYMADKTQILSVRRCPYWSDRCPLISVPLRRQAGVFKGKPPVDLAVDFQVLANDALNISMDSAQYALVPITMTDPQKNPNIDAMILTMGAIWETSPADTQFAQFPPLWKDGLAIIELARAQVMQTLSVNPSMMTQVASAKKPNQAELAQEQDVEVLTTAASVAVLEEQVLTRLLTYFLELDHQFRQEAILLESSMANGADRALVKVPPNLIFKTATFTWYGVEATRNAQQAQNQIAALNVLRGIPPALYPGYRLNLEPAINAMTLGVFGPRMAPRIFESLMNLPPGAQATELMRKHADIAGMLGSPGTPPQGAGIPGQPGQPRPGGQPEAPPGGQRPAGMIPQDQLKGAGVQPRPQRNAAMNQ